MDTTEVTNTSWFSRLGNSIKGILVGIVLFLAGIGLTAWNEGRAVKTAKGLEEGTSAVISVESASVNSANEGRLVHITGQATTGETLRDDIFGLEAKALKLKRDVEMLQWEQKTSSKTRNKLGGGTETVTTYTYEKTWSDNVIPSDGFKEAAGHANPGVMPVESTTLSAKVITVGGFQLGSGLAARVGRFEPVPPPAKVPPEYKVRGNTIYKGANPDSPVIGDVRVTFSAAMPAEVSIVARQIGGKLEPYKTKTGTSVELLKEGSVTAADMFAAAVSSNKTMTWLLRFGGFLAMFIGMNMLLAPFGVLADVLPFLGSIMRFGTTLIALVVAVPVSLGTIAIAWLAYRPGLAITLMVVGVAVPVGLLILKKRKPAPAVA
jgi:hypothetical protein